MTSKHRHNRPMWRSLYIWHRYLGLAAALVVILIAMTGLLLNHTEDLALDERHTTSQAVLDWYGIGHADSISFAAGRHWVSLYDNGLYIDSQSLEMTAQQLTGALLYDDIIVTATGDALHLFTPQGDLIETLAVDSHIPSQITAIGTSPDDTIILRAQGTLHALNPDMTAARPVETAGNITWSSPGTPPAVTVDNISADAFATALTLERVLLDLHSGRLFGGTFGVYLFDLFTLIFMFLSLSGVTIWLKQHYKHRQYQKKQNKP